MQLRQQASATIDLSIFAWREPQNTRSDCSKFVDELIRRINMPLAFQQGVGRNLALWARDDLHPRSQAGKLGFDRFKNQYIAGGQNGGALVHIAGVAGVTLVGDFLTHIVAGQTGYQAARAQYEEDSSQLQQGLDLRAAGYKTLADRLDPKKSMIHGYDPSRSVDDYINEKQAEREDDAAGAWVGGVLGQVYAGKVKSDDAREQIFNRLCDK